MKFLLVFTIVLLQFSEASSISNIVKPVYKELKALAKSTKSKSGKLAGIKSFKRYGGKKAVSPEAVPMIEKYGDEGFYLLKRCPNAPLLYKKYGDSYIRAADKFGAKRVSKWIEEADRTNHGGKVLRYLEKFGMTAVRFYEQNWGKLLATGFVLLNQDEILASTKDLGYHALDQGEKMVVEGSTGLLRTALDSQLVYGGIFAIALFALFGVWKRWDIYKRRINKIS